MDKDTLIKKMFEIIEPIVNEKGLELYHIEYVKEAGENFLRVYIDRESGVTLEDCEKVSRPISDMLDIEDPINETYYLEVSSPGIERNLYTDRHLKAYIGSKVEVKLSKLVEGKKLYQGSLVDFNSESITIFHEDKDIIIPRDKIKTISLIGDL